MNNANSTHDIVMRRVRVIHRVRPLLSNTVFAAIAFALSLYAIGREVWVARVFENMPSVSHVYAFGRFFFNAFLSTEFVVQIVLMLMLVAFAWFVREIGKAARVPWVRFGY